MIEVLQAGFLSSIQDLGRFGYRNYGVPVSGAMDSVSANLGNALLNNDLNCAVLEITLIGPKLKFLADTIIVLTGGDFSAKLNDQPIARFKQISIKKGAIISLKSASEGQRGYMAIHGGFRTALVLNSRSYYSGITDKFRIVTGDKLPFNAISEEVKHFGTIRKPEMFYNALEIEVEKGPDLDLFSETEKNKLFLSNYSISKDSNRMGIRLEESVVKHHKSIITGPVMPGTVQLTNNGNLIVLMKDAQTTGGYPRVMQLSEKAIAHIAQKRTNEQIKFKLKSI